MRNKKNNWPNYELIFVNKSVRKNMYQIYSTNDFLLKKIDIKNKIYFNYDISINLNWLHN